MRIQISTIVMTAQQVLPQRQQPLLQLLLPLQPLYQQQQLPLPLTLLLLQLLQLLLQLQQKQPKVKL